MYHLRKNYSNMYLTILSLLYPIVTILKAFVFCVYCLFLWEMSQEWQQSWNLWKFCLSGRAGLKEISWVFLGGEWASSSWPDICALSSGGWPCLSAEDSCLPLFPGEKLHPFSGMCSLPSQRQASRLSIFDPGSTRRLQVPPMAFVPNFWLLSIFSPFLYSHLLTLWNWS